MRPVSTEKKMFSKRHKQQKNTIKNIITKKTTQQEESPEKKKKNKKTTTNNKNEHIKSKPGFPKFLFLFFVCLFCCCFVTLCFLFFYVVFFLFLVFKFDFVCLLCCFLFVYTTLYYLRRWPDNSRHMDTLATPKSKCQDMSRWLCVLAKLENVFLTTFDCSWRCNHCQSARYPGKKYKFFAGERRYSH
jgi:magnesium-transporting ATPase (P-type)